MIGILVVLIFSIFAFFALALCGRRFRRWLFRPLRQWAGRDEPREPKL